MPAILGSCGHVVKHLFNLTLIRAIGRLFLMRTSVGYTVFFCALLVAGFSLAGVTEEDASIFEGVKFRDLGGVEVAIDSLLAAGPLVVNFWATWCTPCKLEMPHLEKIYREFEPQGVQFAAISVDHKSHAGRIKTFLEKQKMSVPVYLDHDTRLARGFNVRAIPTTIIILQDGSLFHRNKGYRPGDEVILRKHIQSLVEGADTTGTGAARAGGAAAGKAVQKGGLDQTEGDPLEPPEKAVEAGD